MGYALVAISFVVKSCFTWFNFVQQLHYNKAMPTLFKLSNCKIEMRIRDHRPAHVHVVFADGREALVYLADLQVVARQRILASELAPALAWLAPRLKKLAFDFEELQK